MFKHSLYPCSYLARIILPIPATHFEKTTFLSGPKYLEDPVQLFSRIYTFLEHWQTFKSFKKNFRNKIIAFIYRPSFWVQFSATYAKFSFVNRCNWYPCIIYYSKRSTMGNFLWNFFLVIASFDINIKFDCCTYDVSI